MTEALLFFAGLLAGTGIGTFIFMRWGMEWAIKILGDDDAFVRDLFAQGVKAQAELGFMVKKVPVDGSSTIASTPNGATPEKPAPRLRLRQDHEGPIKGIEHPSGPVPPGPEDFARMTPPHNLSERMKSI